MSALLIPIRITVCVVGAALVAMLLLAFAIGLVFER
jgi:hypothetical protein